MFEKQIVIGTRGSQLALTQSEFVKAALMEKYPEITVKIRVIRTKGDVILDTPLAKIGDKGLFTKEIEQALLIKEVDLAVHSMKDLPTKLPSGLVIGAIMEREDARDAFVSYKYDKFSQLPQGAIVATSSLRRRANVLMHRPDIQLVDIRGNVETRLRKLNENGYDGILLAVAGLKRLGFQDIITEIIDAERMLPAVAQGALGIEVRQDDENILKLLAPLDHLPTRASVTAERSFLRELEGGCQVPIGAYAQVQNGKLSLQGIVSDLDGVRHFKGAVSGALAEAENLGKELGQQLINQGAQQILDEIYHEQRK